MGVSTVSPDRALIVWEPSANAPAGYLKANGALISRTAYAWLFGRIGVTFGAGDGSTTFALPDLRGEFLRGLDDGRGVDAARVLGSAQAANIASHSHGYTAPSGTFLVWDAGSGNAAYPSAAPGAQTSGAAGSGTDTRPRNIAGLYCIAYAP